MAAFYFFHESISIKDVYCNVILKNTDNNINDIIWPGDVESASNLTHLVILKRP